MHKRWIWLLFAALMLFGALSACAPQSSGAPWGIFGRKRDVVSVSVMADYWPPDMEWDTQQDEYARLLFERFQFIVEPAAASGAPAEMAAAGTLPDAFAVSFGWNTEALDALIDSGAVRPIPLAMIEKYPRVKELIDGNGLYVKSVAALRGVGDAVFSIPRPVDHEGISAGALYAAGGHGIDYRADWAKKLGIARPQTLDEYYDMLKAFATRDPDGNGAADTLGLSAPGARALFGIVMPAVFGTAAGGATWYYDSGQQRWMPAAFHPNMADMLEWYKRLADEGLLDPDFPRLSLEGSLQKVVMDQAGAMPRIADTWSIFSVMHEQLASVLGWSEEQALERIGTIVALKRDDADVFRTYRTAEAIGASGTMFSAELSDEELERYLEVYDWMLGEESRLIVSFGFEGEHWRWNDDKTRVIVRANPSTGRQYNVMADISKAAAFGGAMASWDADIDFGFEFSALPGEGYRQRSKELREEWRRYLTPAPSNPAASLIDVPDLDPLALDASDIYARIVQGNPPAREAFAGWVQHMLNTGADRAIEAFNQKAAQLGIDPAKQGF